ncbi:MAG: GMC family oxidoreductase N-terminal domain-containing protein [Thermomicrobiales bacterium]|nr:GMC family oxidoreductase N-terminal domain-containing protein [Thermomicrobiales bacterium]
MQGPRIADTVVIGGGTSGAVVAGLLAEHSNEQIVVLEAGPDFGPFQDGRWPADLLDARALGYTHDWQYTSEDTYPDRIVPFERARVIGGCSAHNGCAAIWGSRIDYDAWAAAGLDGWATGELEPLFARANERMRVKDYAESEVTPFHRAVLLAAESAGIHRTANLNDLDEDEGMAPSPVNIADGVRWNSAFAYLDPVRYRANLTVIGDAIGDRIEIRDGRATRVHYVGPNGPEYIEAGRVVVAGGTYGSPSVLLRSGVGDPEALRGAGIAPVHNLPGVGKNLHDHSAVMLSWAGTRELESRMESFAAEMWMPEEQTIAKIRSSHYPVGEVGFDLHIYPVGGPTAEGWRWDFPVGCMTPLSRGEVTLRSADPSASPRIEHRYLSDEAGHDRNVLIDGVRKARQIAAQSPLRELIGVETAPTSRAQTDDEIGAWVDGSVFHYYHPVGTCAMGPASNTTAVTDARGKIHGLENVFVADCSIIPTIPRANTNIPAVVIGERIAGWLLG